MKAILCLLFSSLTFAAWAQESFSDALFKANASPLLQGLQAYYPLNETSGVRYDKAHHGLHMTNNANVGFSYGVVNYCATFTNALSQYLTSPNHADIQTAGKQYTIALWFKLTTTNTYYTLAAKSDGSSTEWALDYDPLPDLGPGTDHRLLFLRRNSTDTGWFALVATTIGMIAGDTWYFVAAGWDGANIWCKVNNGAQDTLIAADPGLSNSIGLSLGAKSNGASPLDGKIDEFGFWNRTLTAAELSQLYNSGAGQRYPLFQCWSATNNLPYQIHVRNAADATFYKTNLIREVYGTLTLPTEIGTLSPVTNCVTGLTNGGTSYKMSMTGWASRPRVWTAVATNGKAMLLYQGHGSDYNTARYNEVLQLYLNNNLTVVGMVLPDGPDDITSGGLHNITRRPLSDFLGQVVVSVNTLTNAGYSTIYMNGLSGGGWATALAAAMDDRIAKSFQVAGSLPLYDYTDRDWEQWIDARGIFETYQDLYILATTSGRTQLQILHTLDPCCFSLANYSAGPAFDPTVSAIATSLGGSYSLIWEVKAVHEWDPAIVTSDILPEL